ncbi:hypothetical protein ZWY2020_007606 [Hordeum vulgare]|nr:hypothetical protein ZWY2020_007606 [Hordeum vulgare]
MRTYDHLFASRPHSTVGDIVSNGSTNMALAPYDDYWQQTKKLVTTHLLATRKVCSNRVAREKEVRLFRARLHNSGRGNQMYWEQLEIHCKLLGGFNLSDYFPILARLDMVTAKAMKLKRTWDDLLDGLINKHALEQDAEG